MKTAALAQKHAAIIGSGHYVPSRVVSNDELESFLGLASGFIFSRTGITERRWSAPDENVCSMAIAASTAAITNAGVSKIDRIIVCRDAIITKRVVSIALPVMSALNDIGIDVSGAFSIDICNIVPVLFMPCTSLG